MPDSVDLTWVWGIGLMGLAVGIGLGIGIAYLALGSCRRARELATKLEALQQEADTYKDQVAQHFLKTSQLVQRMTDSYRDVYRHLATGSQTLCKEPLATPRLDIAESLSAKSEQRPKIKDNEAVRSFSDGETDELDDEDSDAFLGDSPRVPDLEGEARKPKFDAKRRTPP